MWCVPILDMETSLWLGRLFCCSLFLSTVQRVRNEVMPKKKKRRVIWELRRRTGCMKCAPRFRLHPIAFRSSLLVRCLYLSWNILRIHEVLQLKFGNLEAGRACNEIHLALQCDNRKRRLIGIDFNYCEKKTVVSNRCFKHLANTIKWTPQTFYFGDNPYI